MLTRFETLLKHALRYQVTDIHFNFQESRISIEMRGLKGLIPYQPSFEIKPLVEYLKYRADLDLTNINAPKTGSFSYVYKGKEYFFRLAVITTFKAENLVLRILNVTYISGVLSKDSKQNEIFSKITTLDNGLVIFSGPTGSGKTTTLYNIINQMEKRKIYTIEDPIEIYFEKFVQIQVNEALNLDYGQAIKQVLRHDPDVIVIGEIRDELEAKMAIRAALTGHLVLATLHATNCQEVILRLLDLGVIKYDLLATLKYIVNQRLITLPTLRYPKYEIIDTEIIKNSNI